jgi:hypothetical protein
MTKHVVLAANNLNIEYEAEVKIFHGVQIDLLTGVYGHEERPQ